MATNKPRYTVSVDDEMFKAIENFRFENRFQTRSEATVELIRLGLGQLKKEQEEQKKRKKISPPVRRMNEQSSYGKNARPSGV